MFTKMNQIIDEVKENVAERDELIECIAICLIARKNLFILGDTGQAKSYAINEFRKRIKGTKQFRIQPTCENGDIVVVRVDNENATVKRFNRVGNIVQLIPQSLNSEHQIQEYDLKKTKIDIVGKVVECKIRF